MDAELVKMMMRNQRLVACAHCGENIDLITVDPDTLEDNFVYKGGELSYIEISHTLCVARAALALLGDGVFPCSCHMGSVCGEACDRGRHHDGCTA